MRLFLILLVSLLTIHSGTSQNLSNEQEAWLYRIIQKTPVLYRNWDSYLQFDTEAFEQNSIKGPKVDYDAIEYYQINKPQSLNINWNKIKSSSPGLISEASTLLAIYELNHQLVKTYKQGSYNDSLYDNFSKQLEPYLPGKTKTRKKAPILQQIIHPSLPLNNKVKALTDDYKLSAREQQKLLTQWRSLLNEYFLQRSRYFFEQISTANEFHNMLLLAAGEGSGTAGLLYEKEKHPEDINKAWYGKAIGLFTYDVDIKRDKVRPNEKTQGHISTFNSSSASLHFSMWGLNSSFKPMVVISSKDKSYLLFSDINSMELSPDPKRGKGLSYIDRIEQYRDKNITQPLKELQQESSLATILDKEIELKENIENNLEQLELEIDSLQKLSPLPEAAINHRKKLIESHLTNLTQKEVRVKNVQNKLSTEYRKIDNARERVRKMNTVLGDNPQDWIEENNEYIFNDGVIFRKSTQDLIFPDSLKPEQINIDLLSASYSLKGEQRDEVQLLVNSTTPPAIKTRASIKPVTVDTFTFKSYFRPDEYISILLDTEKHQLDSIKHISLLLKTKPIHLKANSPKKYESIERECSLPISELGQLRTALARLIIKGDTAEVEIISSTDPVPTRLSKLPADLRQKLGIDKASVHNNNYLSALRGLYMLNQLLQNADLSEIKLFYPLSQQEIMLLWEHVTF